MPLAPRSYRVPQQTAFYKILDFATTSTVAITHRPRRRPRSQGCAHRCLRVAQLSPATRRRNSCIAIIIFKFIPSMICPLISRPLRAPFHLPGIPYRAECIAHASGTPARAGCRTARRGLGYIYLINNLKPLSHLTAGVAHVPCPGDFSRLIFPPSCPSGDCPKGDAEAS